jgi:hypothetical protein
MKSQRLIIEGLQHRLSRWYGDHKRTLSIIGVVVLTAAALAYLGYAIYYDADGAIPLIVGAAVLFVAAVYYGVKYKWVSRISERWLLPARERAEAAWDPWGRR